MKRLSVLTLAMIALIFAAPLSAQDDEAEEESSADVITVERLVICTDIVDREPVGEGTAFPDSIGKLFAFTHITGAANPTEITHRWLHGDSVMAEVTLPVNSTSWRTNSSKNIWHTWTGPWKVEVVNSAGEVIGETTFTIEKTE